MASNAVSCDSFHPFEFDESVKVLADSSTNRVVPSKFNFSNEQTALPLDSIPVVDVSALIAGDADQRSKAVNDLATACRGWGFFLLVNHGIPERLISAMLTTMREFFNLPESVKKQYEAKNASDPIKSGNFKCKDITSKKTFTLWREYLKCVVHPEFHCPNQPLLLREVMLEYTQKTQKLVKKLMEADPPMEALCEALELDEYNVDEVLKMDSSFQVLAANYYPPCPHPDQAIGIPSHTDCGLFTFLINNGVSGLQVERDGQWFKVDNPPNSILVNVDDHLEIFTNGWCKSVKHRAVVNEESERLSIVIVNGPWREAVVCPAAQLVEKDGRSRYIPMKYGDYMESQLTKTHLGGLSMLEQLMINDN